MTLSEVSILLPPPEGMEWRSMPDGSFIAAGDVSRIRIRPSPGWGWKINAENCGVTFGCEAHTDVDIPSAYLRALAAVGLAPDPEVEALRAEVAGLRRTVRECPTCDGGGIMGAVVGVTAPDGDEVIQDVTCEECHGTGVSSWGEALDEADRLRLEVADLRRRLTWTSEVPREAGAYAVTWANKIDSDVYGWTRFDGGTHPWQNDDGARSTDAEMRQHGARFLPLANLKETR